MEDSQIKQTTQDDLKRFEELLVGNSVRSMRLVQKRIKRRMVIYESRLVELYRNEKIIKARIYNNVDALKIDADYTAGKGKSNSPTQSFESDSISDVPHQNLSYDKDKILTMEEGVRKLDAEINRINGEIKDFQTTLYLYEEKYKEISADLKKAEKDKDKKNSIGRFLAPTEEELLADEIAQAKTYHVLLLQGITEQFANLTKPKPLVQQQVEETYQDLLDYFDKDAVSAYPDGDNRTVNQLKIYQQLFWAHGHTKGLTAKDAEGEVVPLFTLLNFDNPADSQNILVLRSVVVSARGPARSTKKMTLAVDRYLKDVENVVSDPLTSNGVEIRPDITLSVKESKRAQTISYPSSAIRIGDFYLGSFELPSLLDSIRKNWKKRNSRLYFELPICPYAEPTGTSTDTKEKEASVAKEVKDIEAQDIYVQKSEEAEEVVIEEVKKKNADLPTDAKEWATIYVQKYERGNKGKIVYEGNNRTVLRGVSSESIAVAYRRASLMETFKSSENMEEKDRYDYESVVRIRIIDEDLTYGSVQVSPEQLAEIDAGETVEGTPVHGRRNSKVIRRTVGTSKRTEFYEFVAFTLWGKKDS